MDPHDDDPLDYTAHRLLPQSFLTAYPQPQQQQQYLVYRQQPQNTSAAAAAISASYGRSPYSEPPTLAPTSSGNTPNYRPQASDLTSALMASAASSPSNHPGTTFALPYSHGGHSPASSAAALGAGSGGLPQGLPQPIAGPQYLMASSSAAALTANMSSSSLSRPADSPMTSNAHLRINGPMATASGTGMGVMAGSVGATVSAAPLSMTNPASTMNNNSATVAAPPPQTQVATAPPSVAPINTTTTNNIYHSTTTTNQTHNSNHNLNKNNFAYNNSYNSTMAGTGMPENSMAYAYDQEVFARNRELAQADPDYSRAMSSNNNSQQNSYATYPYTNNQNNPYSISQQANLNDGQETPELFRPTLSSRVKKQTQQQQRAAAAAAAAYTSSPYGTATPTTVAATAASSPAPPASSVVRTSSPMTSSTNQYHQQYGTSLLKQNEQYATKMAPSSSPSPSAAAQIANQTRQSKANTAAAHAAHAAHVAVAAAAAGGQSAMMAAAANTSNPTIAGTTGSPRSRGVRKKSDVKAKILLRKDDSPYGIMPGVPVNSRALDDSAYQSYQYSRSKPQPPPLPQQQQHTPTVSATQTKPPMLTLEYLQLQQQQAAAAKGQRRHYNEGYKDRIKSLDKPGAPGSYRLNLDRAQTIKELQHIFSQISALEPRCQAALDTSQNSELLASYDEDKWNEIADEQIKLVELYGDFLFYASVGGQDEDPSSSSSRGLQGLVRKYKIPTRMWNYGISLFIDSLRDARPQYTAVLGRFIVHCMNLLMLYVDPIYETRHVWIESLGDLAFVCLISDVKACADWPEMCMYWYGQRMMLTPGTGRVYRHMASISTVRMDKLFYICKSMTTTQPADLGDSGEILSMLWQSKDYMAVTASSSANQILGGLEGGPIAQSIRDVCLLHLQAMGYIDFERFTVSSTLKTAIINSGCAFLNRKTKSAEGSERNGRPFLLWRDPPGSSSTPPDPIVAHGAVVAFCNIAALLGHGSHDHPLFRLFFMFYQKKRANSSGGKSSSTNSSTTTQESITSSAEYEQYIRQFWDLSPEYETAKETENAAHVQTELTVRRIRQIAMPRLLSFEMLYAFLSAKEWPVGLQHVIVYLYFFIALCESFPASTGPHSTSPNDIIYHVYFTGFDAELFAGYLNKLVDVAARNKFPVDLKTGETAEFNYGGIAEVPEDGLAIDLMKRREIAEIRRQYLRKQKRRNKGGKRGGDRGYEENEYEDEDVEDEDDDIEEDDEEDDDDDYGTRGMKYDSNKEAFRGLLGNGVDDTVYVGDARHVRPIPRVEDRPLPEEYHIRGFVWTAALSKYPWVSVSATANCGHGRGAAANATNIANAAAANLAHAYKGFSQVGEGDAGTGGAGRRKDPLIGPLEVGVPDEAHVAAAGPEYLDVVRVRRALKLGVDLAQICPWLGIDYNARRFVARSM